MAVPQKHIRAILDVIVKHVDRQNVANILDDLIRTEAYRSNKSFRVTIDRLIETWRKTL